MSAEATIRDTVRKLTNTHLEDKVQMILASVTAVDEDSFTCSAAAIGGVGGAPIDGIQLMSEVDDGFLRIPALGSTIMIMYSTRNVPFVAMYSGLDRILLNGSSSSIEISADGITLNDGSLGGLVQIEPLLQKINNLENLLNDLIAKYNIHIHPATSGTTSPTVTQETGTLTPTVQADLENTSITQGI